MTTQPERLTDEQLTELAAVAARAASDPFFVSDCEGDLQVWREEALTHVRRDDTGTITMYSFPSSYRSTDQVIEIDLDTWDPGEDAMDDHRRQDINDLVAARAALPALLDELQLLRAQLDAEKQAHRFTLRQRNNRSNRLTHLRDLALAGDTEALLDAAKDTLAASRGDHDGCHTATTPAKEQPDAEESEACAKCKQPFDPTDTRFDGRAQHKLTPYCRACVDRCHDNEIADHRCVICA
jgi:hypothetical protein